jgi:sugar/nucleoside kinase (ribokinase family)
MGEFMTDLRYDVVGLGNAIVDVIAPTTDAFLEQWGILRNAMNLIEEDRAVALTAQAKGAVVTSGGSGANTIAGVASFGGDAAYIGKVANDNLGAQFRSEMVAGGVPFDTLPLIGGPATARSIIFVTEDGARSMNTYLGASVLFNPDDVDPETVASGRFLYLEGYLFDKDDAKAAFIHASEIAAAAGRRVALTLSDPFCVERHTESFRHLVRGHTDVLFANEEELLKLYQTDDFDAAVERLSSEVAVAAVTRGAAGSIVIGDDAPMAIPAEPVDQVVDTTGAGDQYAAGFLMGLARELPLATCAKLGHLAAAEVISHYGPRPEVSLERLAAEAGISL